MTKLAITLQKRGVKKTLCIILIILLSIGGFGFYRFQHQATAASPVISKEETVIRGNIIDGLSEEGTASVSTVSTQLDVDVTIDDTKVNLDVVIDDVLVRAGENVTKGQPLFTIEATSLQNVLNTLDNEYQQAALKLEQAQIAQQKDSANAGATLSSDQTLANISENTYQSSINKITNQLAQYEQNVKNNQDDYTYYTKLYNTYDERTANLAVFKRLVESGKENYEALADLFDDYQKDNGDVVTTYNNAQKTADSLEESLTTARNDLSYLDGHTNDPAYTEEVTKAQETFSSIASQFDAAIELIDQYSSKADAYTSLEDRVDDAKDSYDEAQEKYDTYNAEYKELFGTLGKSDLARKVAQLEIDIKTAEQELADYQLNYDANILAAENQKMQDQTTSATADLTYQSTLNQLQLAVLTAQNKVDKLGAAISKMNSLLQGQTIVAPCDGLVTSVGFAQGDEVDLLEAAITIAKPDELSIALTMDQEDIGNVALDQEAIVSFDAFSDQTFTGKVSAISVSPAKMGSPTVTYTVTVALAGEGLQSIYEGMSCQVELVLSRVDDVLKVSKRAISTENGSSTVKLKNADGTTTVQEITTGFTDGTDVEILSGLSEGDIVLIESQMNNASAGSSKAQGTAPTGNSESAPPNPSESQVKPSDASGNS